MNIWLEIMTFKWLQKKFTFKWAPYENYGTGGVIILQFFILFDNII